MAISFDASSSGFTNSGTSVTFSHTCSGTNKILFVGVMVASSTTISSVFYGGLPMTSINRSSGGQQCALYYLLNPPGGSNNVVVTIGSTSYCYCASLSYTGVLQTSQPDANNTNFSAATTSLTTSVTTVADNAWAVLLARNDTDGNTSAGIGSTLRVGGGSGLVQMYDSGSRKSPAGSLSMVVTNVGSYDTSSAMASFSPSSGVIQRDATSSASSASASSLTWSHTCSGSDRILIVTVGMNADTTCTCTYNGVSMTEIGNAQRSAGGVKTFLFYLIAPATGTNNIVATLGTATGVAGGAVSYTGTRQYAQPDSSTATFNDATTSFAVSTTVVASDCWLVGGTRMQDGLAEPTTAGGITLTEAPTTGAGQKTTLSDSNGTVGTGSQSITWGQSAADNISGVVASIAPKDSQNFRRFPPLRPAIFTPGHAR